MIKRCENCGCPLPIKAFDTDETGKLFDWCIGCVAAPNAVEEIKRNALDRIMRLPL